MAASGLPSAQPQVNSWATSRDGFPVARQERSKLRKYDGLGGQKLTWDEFPVMTSRILTLAGILCLMGSAVVGWAMITQGYLFEAEALWPAVLGVWVGSILIVRGTTNAETEKSGSLPYLRVCYLIKALSWAVAMIVQPDWGDWGYWQSLVPNAYFCQEADIMATAVWCTLENVALAFSISSLRARRSAIPFGLAWLSAWHALYVLNPLAITTTGYLLAKTGSWRRVSSKERPEDLGIGFSPEG